MRKHFLNRRKRPMGRDETEFFSSIQTKIGRWAHNSSKRVESSLRAFYSSELLKGLILPNRTLIMSR